jgi:prepilin-type N-terminal cleavage/methylation domain-containing protein
MLRALEALRRRTRSERGMTLIELVVGLAILSVILVVCGTVLAGMQRALNRQTDRSGSNDQARLAVEELDKEIRSGNVLYDPGLAGKAWSDDPTNSVYPGMALLIYTQTNAVTRNPGNKCVQWRIINGQLQRRDWATTWSIDGNVSPWRLIADHIVNQPNPPTPPITPAFAIDTDPNKGGRTVIVNILVNQNAVSGQTVSIKASVSGRNTEYGYPSNVCASIPPY